MTQSLPVTAPKADKAPSQTRRAVAQLREMIMSNQLPPGSTHLESELADMLGMSRTPIREAALILAGQGLVEARPRRGVRIVPVEARDMQEIYAILTELEALAAHDVAARGAGAADLAALNALLDQMVAALETDDRRAWAEADDAFHRKLVAMADNRRLLSVVSQILGPGPPRAHADPLHAPRAAPLQQRAPRACRRHRATRRERRPRNPPRPPRGGQGHDDQIDRLARAEGRLISDQTQPEPKRVARLKPTGSACDARLSKQSPLGAVSGRFFRYITKSFTEERLCLEVTHVLTLLALRKHRGGV